MRRAAARRAIAARVFSDTPSSRRRSRCRSCCSSAPDYWCAASRACRIDRSASTPTRRDRAAAPPPRSLCVTAAERRVPRSTGFCCRRAAGGRIGGRRQHASPHGLQRAASAQSARSTASDAPGGIPDRHASLLSNHGDSDPPGARLRRARRRRIARRHRRERNGGTASLAWRRSGRRDADGAGLWRVLSKAGDRCRGRHASSRSRQGSRSRDLPAGLAGVLALLRPRRAHAVDSRGTGADAPRRGRTRRLHRPHQRRAEPRVARRFDVGVAPFEHGAARGVRASLPASSRSWACTA